MAAVELTASSLSGSLLPNGQSLGFKLRGTAIVTNAGARLGILSGNAAASQIPNDDRIRLQLSQLESGPVYELVFSEPGTYPIEFEFVAPLSPAAAD